MLVHVDPATNLRLTLSAYRFGSADPTTELAEGQFWRATHTPIGPATLHLNWTDGPIAIQAWGPGSDWIVAGVNELVGNCDTGLQLPETAHPSVARAHRNHPGLRIGASRTLYHELLPTILGQRVTAGEAIHQWRALCTELGDPAPGPNETLRLPPPPERILGKPAWWYHPFGIEAKRAEALRTVATYATRIEQWSTLAPLEAAQKLQLLRGIGPWTIGSALAHALGDPDAVPVGDRDVSEEPEAVPEAVLVAVDEADAEPVESGLDEGGGVAVDDALAVVEREPLDDGVGEELDDGVIVNEPEGVVV